VGYKKRNFWIENGKQIRLGVKSRTLYFGGGDKPELTIDKLVEMTENALFQFAETTQVVVSYYLNVLKENGISYNGSKLSMNPFA